MVCECLPSTSSLTPTIVIVIFAFCTVVVFVKMLLINYVTKFSSYWQIVVVLLTIEKNLNSLLLSYHRDMANAFVR